MKLNQSNSQSININPSSIPQSNYNANYYNQQINNYQPYIGQQQNYYLPNNNVQSYNGIQQQYNSSQSNMNIPQNIQFNYNQPIGYSP